MQNISRNLGPIDQSSREINLREYKIAKSTISFQGDEGLFLAIF